MFVIGCCNYSCPHLTSGEVMNTHRLQLRQLEVLVNDEAAKNNVASTGEHEKWKVVTKDHGNGETLIILSKT